MLFRQLFDSTSSTYTYLIAADYGRQAIIIDPVIEQIDLYLKLLKEYQVTLNAIIDTHVHADHVTASGQLRKHTGAQVIMGTQSKADCVDKRVTDNEILQFDGFALTALHTPGHTDDSYCYLMDDRVFTGDTLLIRGTGRTDFQHGSAAASYDSIVNKLFLLDDSTLVYPAHDYKGMMVSTIGEEKQFNPRLHNKSQTEYQEIMDNLNLARPKLIDVAVPLNLKCGENNT